MVTPELLMPAGNFEKMQYAFAFGADAVYLGVPQFSLRARENGFKDRSLVVEAIDYAHKLGKKIYITANILPHNHKLDSFVKYVGKFLSECQPDAWIMSDPGLIMLMGESFPDQIIHLSVQANTVNYASARFWQKLGVKRIILSRELSIKEMAVFSAECPGLEFEAFVHGSICIAYSGRCLISNYMSSRDPNQGTCSNSCRWEYKIHEKKEIQPEVLKEGLDSKDIAKTQHGDDYVPLTGDYYLEEAERPGQFFPIDEDENGTYLMNARDLCGIEHLKELSQSGVVSFKVEGRSKSIYFVAMISRAYRKAIDDLQAGKDFNVDHFEDVFATSSRGFIAGFLKGNPGHSAQNFDDGRSQNSTYRFSGVLRGYDEDTKQMKVEMRNPIKEGMSLEMTLPEKTITFEVENLLDQNKNPVEAVHGGAGFCYIPYPTNPGEFVLFREKLTQSTSV
ncbi:Uncharacterized protease YegQ [hydrothermal vent metagenome]|uniref:Uncharacterized protease YegQ n=1 Tax=hydrothermal vent metagenome TaxID=652676 RepID=A0A3B0TE92_9ZZZZ